MSRTAPVSRSTSINLVISTAGRFEQLTRVGSAPLWNTRVGMDAHSEYPWNGQAPYRRTTIDLLFESALVLEDLSKTTLLTSRTVGRRGGHNGWYDAEESEGKSRAEEES